MELDEIRLGVNIDHVATVRNARGTNYPDPLKAAKIVKEAGGNINEIDLLNTKNIKIIASNPNISSKLLEKLDNF